MLASACAVVLLTVCDSGSGNSTGAIANLNTSVVLATQGAPSSADVSRTADAGHSNDSRRPATKRLKKNGNKPPKPASAKPYTAPALVNPVNPMDYGAKCDGVTDDSAAFQAAVNASDVLVPAGKTCVINKKVWITVSNKHIECGDGTILKQTRVPTSADTSDDHTTMFTFKAMSGRISNDSVVNCHFVGTNTEAPQFTGADNYKGYNVPVETQNAVDNFFLAGNTFERFWGQSMFQTYGAVDGGTGDKIIYNTFKSCGYYGPVFVAHTKGLIANNTLTDCSTGVENDNTTQNSGGNIIENNVLQAIHGNGYTGMGAGVLLTGGAATDADYSTNIVRNNTVSGVTDGQGTMAAGTRSKIWIQVTHPAQYSNNTCGTGCTVVQ